MVDEKTGGSTDLRKKAEKKLKALTAPYDETSAEDAGRLVHELRVHQVELEMQNEELRKAQARIEESRARYSDLYDFAPIGYLTLDDRGTIVEANLTGARQLGIERGRLLDTPFVMYIAAQDRTRFLSFFRSLFATRKQQKCEIKLAPKVGDTFFALVDGIFAQGPDSESCRISISDISERKEAEESLRKSARLNDLLLDSLPHPAMLIGPNRTVLAANRMALEMGAKVGGYCWRDFGKSQFIPEEDKQYINDHAGSLPPGGTKCTICLSDEALKESKPANAPEVNSFDRIWSTWWVPLESDTYLHYAVDITERKQMEVALRTSLAESRQREMEIARAEQRLRHAHDTLEQQVDQRTAQLVTVNRQLKQEIQQHGKTHQKLLRTEELYRQTAENIRGVLWMADGEFTEILYVNPAYEEMWGRARDSLYADPKSWLDAVHPEDLEGVLRVVAEIGTREFDMEHRIVHVDGSVRWIWSRSFLIRDESGKAYRVAGIAEDITARKQTEESLRESEQRLRFLSSRLLTAQEDERKRIACELHDSIGSSLTAVKFGLQRTFDDIERGIASMGAGSTLISTTQDAIDEVRRIMMDLRPSILDDLGLVTTIGWLCRQLQSVHSHIGIASEIAIDEEEIPAPLKIVIFRILQEALNNIAKYSKADLVSLSFVKSDSSMELTVEDNGVGFDLSSVLSSKSHERGLGLTSMRERTELAGGRISIESTMGVGTTIRASWPA
jgi:PAS domain S-box-containing protein